MFNSALWHVKNSCGNGGKNSGEFEVYNWLKSLKDRYTWKPSDKQLKALQGVYDWYMSHYPQNKEFESLFDDLLKL